MLENIRIILVNPSHPGNIGAAARAMKTMGLSQLYLVAPKLFPHPEAYTLASGADDILNQACVCNDLATALNGCQLVICTSARERALAIPLLHPKACGALIASHAQAQQSVALVFGRERNGLTNPELMLGHYHVKIPTEDTFSSLNLAAAVQILCYEIRLASLQPTAELPSHQVASADEMAGFYQHLQQSLIALGFLNPAAPKHLMARLQRLFNRAQPDQTELNILRGILTAIQKMLA